MRLDHLLDGITAATAPAIEISDISADSRTVQAGGLFLACRGMSNHGLDFVDAAIARGAAAIAYDSSTADAVPDACAVPLIAVEKLSLQLGEISNRFFDHPSRDVRVAGVTGTNGKSTVAWMIAQCLAFLGKRCAYAGTLGYGIDELTVSDDMTSPDVITTHRRLAGFRNEGATHAAIEVSSHALDQGRVAGVAFDAAVFTNLSRDHLDYHGDMRAYAAAKERLFAEYPAQRRIINVDSDFGMTLAKRNFAYVVQVSTAPDRARSKGDFLFVRGMMPTETGYVVEFESSWGESCFTLPLAGRFNVANAACVLAYLLDEGVSLEAACAALAEVTAPPGRMQRVPAESGPAVYVDYAHTPDALSVTLRALREHSAAGLWVVFGCGGDRDKGKRPEMGRIAEEFADQVVLCNDNPRGESPTAIIDDIVAGLSTPSAAQVIEDRAAAIAWAIANAAADDIVLLAGKGHEKYQIIGSERRDFSDFDAAAANLRHRESKA
jgi:UDP-N-acetylmuramoyl-L-alanyl-D-glutamate--2,6-diaminopimelate ligase